MKTAWLNHVAEVRRKGNRGKRTMSYREAMRSASESWPKKKRKIERAIKRSKSVAGTPQEKGNDQSFQSDQS